MKETEKVLEGWALWMNVKRILLLCEEIVVSTAVYNAETWSRRQEEIEYNGH